jgi:hypothetical protein
VLDVSRKWGSKKLPIDENVAERPNPSAPVQGGVQVETAPTTTNGTQRLAD